MQDVTGSAATAVEQAVTLGVLGVGTAVAAWYLATAVALGACTVAAGLGRRWTGGEAAVRAWGAPVLRRGVSVAAGLALGAGIGLANAAEPEPALPADLGWTPTTSATTASNAPTSAGPSATAKDLTPAGQAEARTGLDRATGPRVVRTGDSLWAIAAADLADRGLTHDEAAIAAEWPRWYVANRTTVGPDPHLIHPGQELQPPVEGALQ